MMRIPITLLLLSIAAIAHAQQFPITRLSVEEGLGHSITYRTFQSRNGYLWFSTDNGITRYDGVNFRNFTTRDGLPANFIFDVVENDSSMVLATFGAGVTIFKDNVFEPFLPDTTSLRYPVTLGVFRDKVWGIDRYKHLYRQGERKFLPVTAAEMAVTDDDYVETYSLCDADSIFLIGTSSGLFSYDGKTFHRFRNPEFTRTNIYNVRLLRNGRLMVTNKNQLLEFDLESRTSTVMFTSDHFSPSTCVYEDHEGNVWLSLINGETFLLRAPDQNGKRETIKILEGVVVNHLVEDRERNMWVSTYGEGAWCIRSIHVRNYPIRGGILSDIMVDRRTNHLMVSTINAGLKSFQQTKGGFLSPVINDPLDRIFRNKKNIVSVTQVSPGFSCFSSDNLFYTWRDNKLDSVKAPSLISVLYHQKTKERIWIGCRFGLAWYEDGKGMQVIENFNKRVIRSIAEDRNGQILLGTDKGIYIETENGFSLLPPEATFSDPYINALFTDPNTGTTWAGTSSGLGKIVRGRLQLVDYPLTRLRCNSIAGDSRGRLWIGTVQGLLCIEGDRYDLITTKEGIAQSNVNKVLYQEKSDLVTLLTSNGVSVLDAENFLEDTRFELPNIIVEQITSGTKPIPFTASMFELGKEQRDLKVIISTPMIKNRDKITFSYRLNDEPWTEFNGRELILKALPYGNLKITVRVQEQFRSNTAKSLTLSLYVPRPFYFTWWFILIILVIISATVAAIVFSYSRQDNKMLMEEVKRLDIEHKALKNLLNPHFLYNAINSIHAFILQNDQRMTLAYLSKFSQLVRLNLELLSADRVPLDKEIKNISLYLEFEKLRFADKLNYEIEIDPKIIQGEVEIPSFLIQPFLENAIWHGLLPRQEGGNLLIRISQEPDVLFITIEDNGVGINTSLKHPKADLEKKTSMGINIIRDRIELLKKINAHYSLTITDKTELNGHYHSSGTVVKITVPV
jgi:ligand-binding sensor domain-containing protein